MAKSTTPTPADAIADPTIQPTPISPTDASTSPSTSPSTDGGNTDELPIAVAPKTPFKILGIRTNVPMPAFESNPVGKSKYPFDELGIGESIAIIGKNKVELASTISGANKRFREAAQPLKNADGTVRYKTTASPITGLPVPTQEIEIEKPKFFFCVDCNPSTDPDGATARIYRRD